MAHIARMTLAVASALLLHATKHGAAVYGLSGTPSPPRKVLRVCQSPGCKDDGAVATFDCLTALAPPGVDVIKGGCVSLCGAGPVVEYCNGADDATTASVKKKRVKGREAIVSLLDYCDGTGEGEVGEPALKPHLRDRLLNGYELSLEAQGAYDAKDYQSAVDLYTEAIESGRKPAMMLQEARCEDGAPSDGYPEGVKWIVASFKNSCRSKLSL
ncbi:hypothetical protein ACHAWF_000421, partial [Thalassiosira exigua]